MIDRLDHRLEGSIQNRENRGRDDGTNGGTRVLMVVAAVSAVVNIPLSIGLSSSMGAEGVLWATVLLRVGAVLTLMGGTWRTRARESGCGLGGVGSG